MAIPDAAHAPFRQTMARVAKLIDDRGSVPEELVIAIDKVVRMWRGREVDIDLLAATKVELWSYLEQKNGDTTSIEGLGDRTVRAALCLTEPSRGDASALWEWAATMLDGSR